MLVEMGRQKAERRLRNRLEIMMDIQLQLRPSEKEISIGDMPSTANVDMVNI